MAIMTKYALTQFLKVKGVETFVILDNEDEHRVIIVIELKKFRDKVKYFFKKNRKDLYTSIYNEMTAGIPLTLNFCNYKEGY